MREREKERDRQSHLEEPLVIFPWVPVLLLGWIHLLIDLKGKTANMRTRMEENNWKYENKSERE